MEHDSPTLLFNLATEYLVAVKTIRPGVTTSAKMVATARIGATALTWEKVAHLLTDERRGDLDRLLMYDAGLKMTRLAWLIEAATDASAASVKTAIEKLTYLRNMDAHTLDLSVLAAERRPFWPRRAAARPTRRWNAARSSASIRSCWRWSPNPL